MKKLLLTALSLFFVMNLTFGHGSDTLYVKITGMTCAGCSNKIHKALGELDGVNYNEVIYPGDMAVIAYNHDQTEKKAILKTITKLGYKVKEASGKEFYSLDKKVEMSNCTKSCAKKCCTYPEPGTHACLCASKGKDCTAHCCANGHH